MLRYGLPATPQHRSAVKRAQEARQVDTLLDTLYVITMKKVNALQLRQSLGKVLASLEKNGEPILLQRGQKPVGVIISLKDFRERFVEKAAAEERHQIFEEMRRLVRKSADPTPT